MVDFIKTGTKVITCQECGMTYKINLDTTYCICPHCSKGSVSVYLGTINGHFH